MRLLRPAQPRALGRSAGKLETLGEFLGDDHDLFMLQEVLKGRSPGSDAARDIGWLSASIGRKHDELRAAALAMGARFYARRPAAFCAQLGNYWHRWRTTK
jgi:hypothetical protein